jgi:hypothetical protein
VISRANLLALYYFRAFGWQASRALGREKNGPRCDEQSEIEPDMSLPFFRAGARAKGSGAPARK